MLTEARVLIRGFVVIAATMFLSVAWQRDAEAQPNSGESESPRIVNIVNFVRQIEPRIDWITNDVLYETVVQQIKDMNQHGLPGTFLVQYDALIDPRYQALLKKLPRDRFEIGVWWEIPQPLVEKAGYQWRGRFPWDWHANVGFATGYSPEQRIKLVDTYMADFKEIFGYYPKSVGSWFIDAHTLNHLVQRYGIVASCNCKDQIGTDGYTLWGGYWNQAYYPSKRNAYMPAQNAENQIQVPVFRMLGSDPIYQYDSGLGTNWQRVISLEPVYDRGGRGGGNPDWCRWYFKEFVDGPAMEFGYVQVGQENSFTWRRMQKGFQTQTEILSRLSQMAKVQMQTLAQSGQWFQDRYQVTPPTSVTALSDNADESLKTVWFNSRFYRANLLWENGTLRFRDIHLFDETFESEYLKRPGKSSKCLYDTLPLVDGFRWSSAKITAGLRFQSLGDLDIRGGQLRVDDSVDGQLTVQWTTLSPTGEVKITFTEGRIAIQAEGDVSRQFQLGLTRSTAVDEPFASVDGNRLKCVFKGAAYDVPVDRGRWKMAPASGLRLLPDQGAIHMEMAKRSAD